MGFGMDAGMGGGHQRVSTMMIACRKASTRTRSRGDGIHMPSTSEVTTHFCILSLSRFGTTFYDTHLSCF